ncbi:MAG: S8 family peptidase [Peptococcia bacterium]
MAIQGRKIVVAKKGDLSEIKIILSRNQVRIIKELPLVNALVVEFPSLSEINLLTRGLTDEVSIEDDLDFELCWLYPWFMPFFPYMPPPQEIKGPSSPIAQRRVDWGIKRIGAPEVWDKLKERRVKVGIIDTGIYDKHPDLQDNIKECVSTLDDNSSYLDDNGHGTHVAGIIGANSGPGGMLGVNPYVDFYVVKAFNRKGSGKLSDIIEGLDWLVRRQVNIINMSFSTSETNSVLDQAIWQAYARGTILVAAAGNSGGENTIKYPAKYPEVIAVSATDSSDRLATFSSTGPEVDFCAPGVNIRSTWLWGAYQQKSGTSFAAPHLAGEVADLLNYYGPMSPRQVRDYLEAGAVQLEGLAPEQQGLGLVEIQRIIT